MYVNFKDKIIELISKIDKKLINTENKYFFYFFVKVYIDKKFTEIEKEYTYNMEGYFKTIPPNKNTCISTINFIGE